MNNSIKHFTANGVEYPLFLSLNVTEWIQEKYGSFAAWADEIAPGGIYDGIINGNYSDLEKFKLGYKPNKVGMFALLADAEKIAGRHFDRQVPEDVIEAIKTMLDDKCVSEPKEKERNIKVLKESFAKMINEGIDAENFFNGGDRKNLTDEQCAYILSFIGEGAAIGLIGDAYKEEENAEDEEKNAK